MKELNSFQYRTDSTGLTMQLTREELSALCDQAGVACRDWQSLASIIGYALLSGEYTPPEHGGLKNHVYQIILELVSDGGQTWITWATEAEIV